MELLLNLVWLVVGLCVSGMAFRRAKREASSKQRWLLGVAALCLCVVLFPAISMTDDLQQVIFASEENPQKLVLSDVHHKAHANVQLVSLLVILLLFHATFARIDRAHRAIAAKLPIEGFLTSAFSRPPPLPLL